MKNCFGSVIFLIVVSNLTPSASAGGLGGESAFIDSHLLDSDGRVRDLSEVAKEIGDATIQFAYLDYELRERLRRPMARGYPPRLFISYRRETLDHVQWCATLARKLEAAGYYVLLDALALPDENPSPQELARFVGQIAAADVALIVLTPSYAGTKTEMRRWIFEELQRITSLRDAGMIEIVWVVRGAGWYKNYEGMANPIDVFDGGD